MILALYRMHIMMSAFIYYDECIHIYYDECIHMYLIKHYICEGTKFINNNNIEAP